MMERRIEGKNLGAQALVAIGRVAVSLFVPIVAFVILWAGFVFLRDSNASQGIIALVAIIWGVGGVAMLFWVADWVVNRLPVMAAKKLQPFVFVGPALVILAWYLFLPTMRSLY
ncbi:MAG: hypothetical protein PHR90_08485, partial [Sphaerochaetaceae bacterium]|nr:hypothetical protein [Sphaerochaetaceae bacterium]